jgi:hypothetical protein
MSWGLHEVPAGSVAMHRPGGWLLNLSLRDVTCRWMRGGRLDYWRDSGVLQQTVRSPRQTLGSERFDSDLLRAIERLPAREEEELLREPARGLAVAQAELCSFRRI